MLKWLKSNSQMTKENTIGERASPMIAEMPEEKVEPIGEPASLIVKALLDENLVWESSRKFYSTGSTTTLTCPSKGFHITTHISHSIHGFHGVTCRSSDTFNKQEQEAVHSAALTRIAAIDAIEEQKQRKLHEEERIATIELFKEYRE